MERLSLSVLLLLFWVISRPVDVYETAESSNSFVKKTESEANYLSRRYFVDGNIKRRIRDREGRIDFSITTSRICNQCKPILCPTKIIEFLGTITNLTKIELPFSEQKVQ